MSAGQFRKSIGHVHCMPVEFILRPPDDRSDDHLQNGSINYSFSCCVQQSKNQPPQTKNMCPLPAFFFFYQKLIASSSSSSSRSSLVPNVLKQVANSATHAAKRPRSTVRLQLLSQEWGRHFLSLYSPRWISSSTSIIVVQQPFSPFPLSPPFPPTFHLLSLSLSVHIFSIPIWPPLN